MHTSLRHCVYIGEGFSFAVYIVCLFLAKDFSIENPLYREIVCQKLANFFFHFFHFFHIFHITFNRPFPGCVWPLSQNESIPNNSHECKSNSFWYERFSTRELVLKQRHEETWKWLVTINSHCLFQHCC